MKKLLDYDPCRAEAHAHMDGRCIGLAGVCMRKPGHRGWHASLNEGFKWNFDQRGCPIPKAHIPDEVPT